MSASTNCMDVRTENACTEKEQTMKEGNNGIENVRERENERKLKKVESLCSAFKKKF